MGAVDTVAFSMLVATTADLVHSFYDDLWNRWDDALVDSVLAPSFDFRGSLGTSTVGRDGWRAYRDTIRAGSVDFHNGVVTLVSDRSSAAARLLYSGTHTGPLLGVEATGRRFEYAGAAFFTAADGLLTSAWVLGDLQALRGQLSA
jgi:predicted ester cyclase